MKKMELEFGPVFIKDDFISRATLTKVQSELVKTDFEYIEYSYRDHPEKEFSYGKQHAYLVNHSPLESILHMDEIRSKLNEAFAVDPRLSDLTVTRVHISKVQYGDDRFFHIDASDQSIFVAVMFLNDVWESSWDGDLVLKDNEQEIRVNPLPGRLIIFNGRIVHRGGLVLKEGVDKYTLVCKLVDKNKLIKAA